MQVDGSCHCGDVQFEAEIDPKRVGICHCTDCQVFSGSAFRLSVMVADTDFHLRKGQPATYEKTAESGAQRQLVFCSRCGTHVYGTTQNAERAIYSVRVGVLAQRAELTPRAQIWCRSEMSWLPQLGEVYRVETQ